ncbi:MAG: precorrin-6A reductase [Faecalibacterium sp.]
MGNICIFAGTTEGRDLAAYLAEFALNVTVCVATEYGEALLQGADALVGKQSVCTQDGQAPAAAGQRAPSGIDIRTGRLTQCEMETFFLAQQFDFIIDCTHPYAVQVTENIVAACAATNTPYRRVVRQSADIGAFTAVDCTVVPDTAAAVAHLAKTQGNILLTIGAKELGAFSDCGFQSRLYARVLPLDASLQACCAAQIAPAQIIAMQGPFTYALNKAMIEAYQITTILTKDGGKVGGFAEKMQIAQDMGLSVVLIQKPEQVGNSLAQIKAELAARYPLRVQSAAQLVNQQVTAPSAVLPVAQAVPCKEKAPWPIQAGKVQVCLVGCGVGDAALMTAQARAAIQEADALVGAQRLTDAFAGAAQVCHHEIYSDKIAAWVAAHPQYQRVAVLLTGDVGFFSGAKKLYDAFAAQGVTDCQTICGISAPIYLCARLQTPWQDAYLLSLHGREGNLVSAVCTHKKVFALLGGAHTAKTVCAMLCEYGMGDVRVSVGENLSYPNEKITQGSARELSELEFAPLSCALILNDTAEDAYQFGIEDDAFVRLPKVPMTKAEVRAVSLSKLKLSPHAIAYDVGAGTGSVSVEMALLATQGQVYAIEKNKDALAAIAQNKQKFKTAHLTLVEGLAPDCMQDLPAPTHVFIGGSSGNLAQIVAQVLSKNPHARFVLNTVTLETLAEAMVLAKQFAEYQVVEIASSQAAALGRYHLMKANNPIYIITFQNK